MKNKYTLSVERRIRIFIGVGAQVDLGELQRLARKILPKISAGSFS